MAQEDPPEGTAHIKYTDAVKYEDGDTSYYKRSYTYNDENWEIIENTATLAAVVNETHKKRITEVNTDRIKIYADIDEKGDTTSKIIFKYDEQGNRTEYYQVLKGDTVVRQKRTYDSRGNNLKLINYKDGAYYLRFENTFNEHDEKIATAYYTPSGYNYKTTLIKRKEKDGKKIIKRFEKKPGQFRRQTGKTIVENGIATSRNYDTYEGINYGIEYTSERGGYSQTKKKNDNLVWWKLYDREGNLTTEVNITYVDYP